MDVQLLNGFPIVKGTRSEYQDIQKRLRNDKEIICLSEPSYAAVLAIAHDMLLHCETVKAKIVPRYSLKDKALLDGRSQANGQQDVTEASAK